MGVESAGRPTARGPFPPDAATLLEDMSAAVVATDLKGQVFFVNAAAERMYGFPRSELLDANVMDVLVMESDQQVGQDIMATVLAGRPWTGEFRVRRADGGYCRVRITDSPIVRDGEVVGIIGVAEDLSQLESARAETVKLSGRLTALAGVIAQLASARDVDTVVEAVVALAGRGVGAAHASLAMLSAGDTLTLVAVRGAGEEALQERWSTIPMSMALPATEAVRTGRPVVAVGRAAIEARFPDAAGAIPGERSLVSLPLTQGGRSVGVIGLSFPGCYNPDAQELEFLTSLADTCAQALERLGALADARDTARKLAFLADVSVELANSLDHRATLTKVAQLAVPTLADWCAVDVVEDGQLHTLAFAHVDPVKAVPAEELHRRFRAEPGASSGVPNVIRTGVSELYPDITDDVLAVGGRDEQQQRRARELHVRSALIVPLAARGRVLGALTLVSAESGRQFDASDVTFAEDVARRAAVAIDNAHLHSETREAAVRLQRAVLPAKPPTAPGWEIAAHYSPAGRTEVGGDFYDVIPLPGGRLAVVVGDVMGRGVAAAAAMAQMRSAVRAYVAVDPDPVVVVTRLDQMFETYDVSQFVTLLYLAIDPDREELVAANAGHLPPIAVTREGAAATLPVPVGLPLGAGPDVREASTRRFVAGTTLVAYTDGLVERLHEDIDVGLDRLVSHAGLLADGSLTARLLQLVDAQHDPQRQDDVTIVAVRRPLPAVTSPVTEPAAAERPGTGR